MWNILISIISFFLNIYDGSENNPSLNPIISNCEKYTPNTFIPSKQCGYGYSGRYCDECGLVFKKPNTKIVGGIEADESSWPSIIYLEFSYKYRNRIFKNVIRTINISCGGSLIDRRTVITAAHCVRKREPYKDFWGTVVNFEVNDLNPSIPSMYTVYVGIYDLRKMNKEPTIKAEVEEIILHPLYNVNGYQVNDIAIIKLKKEIEPNCNIQFACLPKPGFKIKKITDAYAAGWGYIDNDENSPDILHNVKLKIYPKINVDCQPMKPQLPEKQICAGSFDTEVDVCSGDSGGPLYILEKVNGQAKYVLVGLVSYGPNPCAVKEPGVYTKISAYIDWIKEHV